MNIKRKILCISYVALLISATFYVYHLYAYHNYNVEYEDYRDCKYCTIQGKGKYMILRPMASTPLFRMSYQPQTEEDAFNNAIIYYRLEVLRVQSLTSFLSILFLVIIFFIRNWKLKINIEIGEGNDNF